MSSDETPSPVLGAWLRMAPPSPSRRYRILLALLMASALGLGLFTLTTSPPRVDGLRFFSTAYNTAIHGVYSEQFPGRELAQDNQLEPLYPALLMPGLAAATAATGEDLDCFLGGSPECATALWWLKLPNVLLHVLTVGATAWLARRVTGSEPLALVGAAIVAHLYLFQTYVNEFFSDILAAFLFTAATGALVAVLQEPERRRQWTVTAGLLLGLLALTRSAYLYLIIPIGVSLVLALWLSDRSAGRRAVRAGGVLVVVALLMPTVWIVRNQVQVPDASWTQLRGRGVGVLTLRTEFATMTQDEYLAAWVYWSTPTTGRELARDHVDPEDFLRITRSAEDGFYQTNKRGAGRVGRDDEGAALQLYLDEFPRHLGLTPLIAWRGTVPWAQFRLPDGPTWEPRFRMVQEHTYRLLLPGVVAGFVVALRRRDVVLGIFLIPAIGSIAFHALVTHYLPRYSVLIAPVGVIAVLYCVRGAARFVGGAKGIQRLS